MKNLKRLALKVVRFRFRVVERNNRKSNSICKLINVSIQSLTPLEDKSLNNMNAK